MANHTIERVQPGENFQLFCERVGVHPDRILATNREDMELEARGRGFDLMFMRHGKNDDGTDWQRPDCHVFGGQFLKVPQIEDTPEEDV